MSFLATFPEASVSLGKLSIRHDLVNHSVTIQLKDSNLWSIDTEQEQINQRLIHFVEPNGNIVGIKVLGASV